MRQDDKSEGPGAAAERPLRAALRDPPAALARSLALYGLVLVIGFAVIALLIVFGAGLPAIAVAVVGMVVASLAVRQRSHKAEHP